MSPFRQFNGWREVCFSAECDENGACPCGLDYAEECVCPGPTEDEVEYKEVKGTLYGKTTKEN